jgi:hypothetical protein
MTHVSARHHRVPVYLSVQKAADALAERWVLDLLASVSLRQKIMSVARAVRSESCRQTEGAMKLERRKNPALDRGCCFPELSNASTVETVR